MIVDGAIFDREGARAAYARFSRGRLVEVGKRGTDSSRGRERRVRGIVVPSPVNSHTHLGDAVSTIEPPAGPVARLVAAPRGYKFRLLARSSRAAKAAAIRSALARMRRAGVAAVIDFREEGQAGVELLRTASRRSGIQAVILGRPLARPVDAAELRAVLAVADGIGLSSARDEEPATRRTVARACRAAGKRFALHASEAVRESPATYLDPHPDLLVHLARATSEDLRAVRDDGVTVAVCPRSNALFGRQPDLATMERLGVRTILGTDNAMFQAPSIWRELEFAYVGSRLRRRPVSAEFVARAALVEPWRWLGRADVGEIAPGSPAVPLVLRLPPDDPTYQIVTRATEHLILRPGPGPRGA
ncbi:MAG TPA: amidohydrolase family protein [Thermoplasmata archaeon]|nr:amidohydrolase family protein [Thermoplasmata archaeon]